MLSKGRFLGQFIFFPFANQSPADNIKKHSTLPVTLSSYTYRSNNKLKFNNHTLLSAFLFLRLLAHNLTLQYPHRSLAYKFYLFFLSQMGYQKL